MTFIDIDKLNFNVNVFSNNESLCFKVTRIIDGLPLTCAFMITKESLLDKSIESLAEILNMMFETSILEISNRIRKGLENDV
jgi:hypothetical protein